MLFHDLVDTSNRVAHTPKRLEKTAALAAFLGRLRPHEVPIAVRYLIGDLPQGRIGLGWSSIRELRGTTAALEPSLEITDVDRTFTAIAATTGAGSTRERGRLLADLFLRATSAEADFLARLIVGELRQGALEGVMLDGIAKAASVPLKEVRRAHLMAGDLVQVASAALSGGSPALAAFGVQLFRPLQPMLAQTAEDIDDAFGQLGQAAWEYKLDGARIQVHKSDDEVRIYTRGLNEVTSSLPDLVEVVRALPTRDLVLDGEAIALKPDGRPQPFQVTMSRFGRRLDVAIAHEEMALRPFFFDAIYANGETLLDQPAHTRFAALSGIVGEDLLIPRIITGDLGQARSFLASAAAAGHEGLVGKSLEAAYDAGKRGAGWVKVKFTNTLDLVILAAEWGHGRRTGMLSNLHLGARDPANGGFVMLGKTFKGLTDAMLEWQTRELLAREIGRDGHTVYVRPEIVAEIAFDDLLVSTRYPAGLALRFARVKRYRTDKPASQADTIDTVRSLHKL